MHPPARIPGREYATAAAFSDTYPKFLTSFVPGYAAAGFAPDLPPDALKEGSGAESGSGDESAIAIREWHLLKAWTRHLQQSFTLFHAAVLGKEGHALVIPGVTGSGKTTLTLHLLRRGYTFLSDDCAVICPETLRVWPAPGAMHVKAELSEDDRGLLERAVPYPGRFFVGATGAFCCFVAAGHLPVRGESWPVAAVVFPDRTEKAATLAEEAGTLLEPISSAQALCDLTFQSFADTAAGLARDFRVFARLVRSAPVYRLCTADLAAAGDALEVLLAGRSCAGVDSA